MKILFTLLFAFVCSTSFSHTEDTLFYSKGQEVVFDTIPYMVKDQAFLDGLKELQMMLNGEKPYSLKRAEFIVEWAYSGGNMNYKKFCVHQQLGFNYLNKYVHTIYSSRMVVGFIE